MMQVLQFNLFPPTFETIAPDSDCFQIGFTLHINYTLHCYPTLVLYFSD